jgi:fluoride exporter
MANVEGWNQVILLSVGGSLGVNARYWLGVAISRWAGSQFPWATLAINVSGSFAIGLLTVLLARWLPHPYVRLLVVVGFLGGYTTFSSFSAEELVLWERGERALGLAYLGGSVGAGLLAVVLGTMLGRGLVGSAERWHAAEGRAAAVAPPAAPGPQPEDGPIGAGREPSRTSVDPAGGSEASP